MASGIEIFKLMSVLRYLVSGLSSPSAENVHLNLQIIEQFKDLL